MKFPTLRIGWKQRGECDLSTGRSQQLSPVWFFLMGLGEDLLSASYVTLVDVGNGLGAGLIAMMITFLAVFALGKILIEPRFWSIRLWCFAFGNFIGTWLVVNFTK